MEISIYGIKDKRKLLYIHSKAEKYIDLLNIRDSLQNHRLDIRFRKNHPDLHRDEIALCYVPLSVRTNSPIETHHTIIMKKELVLSRYKLLTTLIHELVHLMQYVTKRLMYLKTTETADEVAVWKKNKLGRLSEIDYMSQPWEIEAMKLSSDFWKERKL